MSHRYKTHPIYDHWPLLGCKIFTVCSIQNLESIKPFLLQCILEQYFFTALPSIQKPLLLRASFRCTFAFIKEVSATRKIEWERELAWAKKRLSELLTSFERVVFRSCIASTFYPDWAKLGIFLLLYLVQLIRTTNTNPEFLQRFFCLFTFWVLLPG